MGESNSYRFPDTGALVLASMQRCLRVSPLLLVEVFSSGSEEFGTRLFSRDYLQFGGDFINAFAELLERGATLGDVTAALYESQGCFEDTNHGAGIRQRHVSELLIES